MRTAEENRAVAQAYELAARSRTDAIETARREAWNEAIKAAIAAVGKAMVSDRIDRRQRALRAIRRLHREGQ